MALAAASGLSESALALRAIQIILESAHAFTVPERSAPARERATDRITIRLRPGDGSALARRASARGLKASTYLAGLVRAHLAANPPLPAQELSALKESVSTLADVGRTLRYLIRSPSGTGLRDALEQTQAAVGELEHRTQDLARAALVSWECRGG